MRGLELEGLGGPLLLMKASFMELFLCLLLPPPGANGGRAPLFMELVSEFCLLLLWLGSKGTSFSPKKPCSFFCIRSLALCLEPVEDTVVALAIDGRLSSPSPGKPMP